MPRQKKPGPIAERLKIDLDPQEALRRLLTKPPPEGSKRPKRARAKKAR